MFETKLATEAATSENQDRAAIIEHPDGLLLVIADGAGGIGGGREAAELVTQAVKVSAVPSQHFINPLTYCSLLMEVDNMVYAHPNTGETTAVVVALSDGLVCGASVGDSGAFLVQEQSEINLTAEQRRRPLIGSGIATPTQFGPIPYTGTLVLATDGLIKYATQTSIRQIVLTGDTNDTAKALIESVRYPSGALPDDVTVIVTRKNIQL